MSPGGLLSAGTGAWGLAVPCAATAGAEVSVVPGEEAGDPELPQAARQLMTPATVRAPPSCRAMRALLLSGMPGFYRGAAEAKMKPPVPGQPEEAGAEFRPGQ